MTGGHFTWGSPGTTTPAVSPGGVRKLNDPVHSVHSVYTCGTYAYDLTDVEFEIRGINRKERHLANNMHE